jgi:alpha-tubulin suppressor-like RCC1 family protein
MLFTIIIDTMCMLCVFSCMFSGNGSRGQLGHGYQNQSVGVFTMIKGLPKHITSISAGEGHTALLSSRGEVYLCGDGKHGKLGFDTHSNEFNAAFLTKFRGYVISQVVCGGCQTIILARKILNNEKRQLSDEDDNSECVCVCVFSTHMNNIIDLLLSIRYDTIGDTTTKK